MTRPPIDELAKLVDEATPGPWFWHDDSRGRYSIRTPDRGQLIVMDFARVGMQSAGPRFAVMVDDQPRGRRGGIMEPVDPRQHPDAALIVAAVNALPGLLDRLAAAEADAARYRWLQHDWCTESSDRATRRAIIDAETMEQIDAAIDAAREAGK